MSENEKNPTPGEPISEEQLDAVAGGGGNGSALDPIHHACWFREVGEPREDGRIRCRSECKGLLDPDGKPIHAALKGNNDCWYICSCWGTGFCIDRWHKPCGKPVRTEWGAFKII